MRAAPRWYVAVQRPIFRPTNLPHDHPVGLINMEKRTTALLWRILQKQAIDLVAHPRRLLD